MVTEIEKDVTDVLRALVQWGNSADDEQRGDYFVRGPELAAKVGLAPKRINIAVAFLEKSGLIEAFRTMGVAPFDFSTVRPTVQGHLEAQRTEANGQPTEIERDAATVLRTLVGWAQVDNDPHRGEYRVSGKDLSDKLGLSPQRINNAVAFLEMAGFVTWLRTMGTAPYKFLEATASPEGHLETQRLTEQETRQRDTRLDVFLSHSTLDDNLCKDITALLKNSGLRVFATPASIPTGKWEEQIEEALQNASTVWVLLTPNAMSQSVWIHHEFGYFYGFRHGKGIDSRGDNCRFLYSDSSHLRGLYGHIQGTLVASFEDPVALAGVITSAFERDLSIPQGWVHRRYPTLTPATMNPPRLGRLTQGSQAGPNNSRRIDFTILEPLDRVYNLGVIALHPEAEITLDTPVPFIGPTLNVGFHMQVTWRGQRMDQLPTEATDHAGRTFDVGPGPRQPSGTWPMLITMETDEGRRLAGIVYCRLERHPGDLPDLNMDPPAFLDWREAKRA